MIKWKLHKHLYSHSEKKKDKIKFWIKHHQDVYLAKHHFISEDFFKEYLINLEDYDYD